MDPTIDPGWYKSVLGIVSGTVLIVQVLKRLIGNVPVLMDVPTWVYAAVVSMALTFGSWHFGYLVDQGTLLDLLILAGLSAASASGFWSWFSNGSAAIGDSKSAVVARERSQGGFCRLPVLLLITALALAPLVSVGCALKGTARKTVTVSVLGLHAALAALDDGERMVFDSKATCEGKPCVTADEHRAFSQKLLPILTAARNATVTTREWPAGQPAPPEIRGLINQVSALAVDVTSVFARDNAGKSAILTKVVFVQSAALAILAVIEAQLPTAGGLDPETAVALNAVLDDRIANRADDAQGD